MTGRVSRRGVLAWGVGSLTALVAGAGAVAELVEHDVLPGHTELDRIDGACNVTVPTFDFAAVGPTIDASYFSRARNRTVGYSISYPPGHGPGSELPLIVGLHGNDEDHRRVMAGMTAAQALAIKANGAPLPPMAILAPDGGGTYWHPHPDDDPTAMILDELLPLCRSRGLGRSHPIATLGISMGGYGALLLAEQHPEIFSAVAAIGPAIWRSYPEAHAANPTAYVDAADFAANDVITHVAALDRTPVRVGAGHDDPFHHGVAALARVLPRHAIVDVAKGCHNGPFFETQQLPSLQFLGAHLA